MSSDSSEPGCEGVQEDQALDSDLDGSSPSRDQDPLALPRRSPRLVQRQLLDWPVVRILEVLYANGISAPPGLGHEDLLELLVSRVPAALEDPEPDLAASRKKRGKAPAKKRGAKPAAAPTRKRRKSAPAPAPAPASPAPQPNAEVLSALADIKASLVGVNNRLVVLESTSASGVEPASTSSAELLSLPRRTLGTAVPAPSTGAPFLSPAGAIPDALRSQIIAGIAGLLSPFSLFRVFNQLLMVLCLLLPLSGQDVNLVKILICASDSSDRRLVDCGDFSVFLKDNDPRLSKSLTLAEFNVAFGVFRDTICEAFPARRQELDTYLAIISDLALSYGGTMFHEYHKSFSSKSAMYIQKFNQRIDWSVVDLALISRHFTGRQAVSCAVCGSFSHNSTLCPKSAFQGNTPRLQASAPAGRKSQVPYSPGNNTPICINFNENVCTYRNCKYLHICSWCADSHPRSVCPRRVRSAKPEK